MFEKPSIDNQVSPWDIKLDSSHDYYTHTNKNTTFGLFHAKLNPLIKRRPPKQVEEKKKNYLLIVLKNSREGSMHNSPVESRQQESQSALKVLKQRLRTVNHDEKSIILNSFHDELQQTELTKQPSKSKCSKKTTSRDTNITNPTSQLNHEVRHKPKRNITKCLTNINNSIEQIFVKKQAYSPKSLQRLKSNKKLVLPRIQLCTIER